MTLQEHALPTRAAATRRLLVPILTPLLIAACAGDLAQLQPDRHRSLPPPPVALIGLGQGVFFRIVASSDAVWVLAERRTLLRVDPQQEVVVARITLPSRTSTVPYELEHALVAGEGYL
jgi:hypothetical protein